MEDQRIDDIDFAREGLGGGNRVFIGARASVAHADMDHRVILFEKRGEMFFEFVGIDRGGFRELPRLFHVSE